MLTGTAPRRIAAALTAVVVAWALIALGGASHSTAASQRLAIGHSHAGASLAAAHIGSSAGKHHVSPHPDLASTPPSVDAAAPAGPHTLNVSAHRAHLVRDLPAPTGRGPPAL